MTYTADLHYYITTEFEYARCDCRLAHGGLKKAYTGKNGKREYTWNCDILATKFTLRQVGIRAWLWARSSLVFGVLPHGFSRKRETDRGPLVTCVTTHSCYLLFRFFEAYEYLKKKTKSNSLILLSFIKTPIKGFFFTITQSWGNCEGECSLFPTFGSWGRAKKRVSDRKNEKGQWRGTVREPVKISLTTQSSGMEGAALPSD